MLFDWFLLITLFYYYLFILSLNTKLNGQNYINQIVKTMSVKINVILWF